MALEQVWVAAVMVGAKVVPATPEVGAKAAARVVAAKVLGVVGTGTVGAASVVVETTVEVWGTGELWGTGIGGIGGRLSGWLGGLGRCPGRWG